MKKTVFIFWLAIFGFAANIGFAQSFPENFQGTWKRAQYASTLTFTGKTVKASNRDIVWTLRSIYGDRCTIVSSGTGTVLALTIKLVNGNLEIAGDSGAGEGNWNGTWINTLFAAVTFNSQGGSAVAPQGVTKGNTVPYPEEPVKAGAYFDGWYKEARCTNPCDYAAPVNGALTLYAKWLTEKEMIAGEFGEGVPEIFEVNNATATAEGQPGWNNSWAKASAAINSGGNGKNYVIKITGNFQLAGDSSSTFGPGNIKVLVYAPVNKTVSLSGSGSLLRAGASQTLILRNITLLGSADNDDSMVHSSGTNAHLAMRPGTVITKNTITGVRVDGGTFTMSGGVISDNNASHGGDGGGVRVESGIFMMNGGTISGNRAFGGGGVCVEDGTFTMSGGSISSNTGRGGVRVQGGGTFTMGGGTVSDNSDDCGVSVFGGTFTMRSGTISGVIIDNDGVFTMGGGTIVGNTASGGGGVYVASGTFTMSGGAISGNTASDNGGGGVYVNDRGTFTMSGGAISSNTGHSSSYYSTLDGYGGGVCVDGGTFTMNGGTINGNMATEVGGGVYVASGTFTMGSGSISGNKVDGGGGGVRVAGGTFRMGGGTISGNAASSAYGDGGGVYVESGTFWLRGGTVYGRGAKTGLANTAKSGASLSIKDSAAIAKYDSGGDLIESGLATDATLVGHEVSPEKPSTGATNAAAAAESPAFPENFQGTWKRPQYASTLTFTGNTVKASNRDVFWTLRSVSGNRWTIVSSGTRAVLALTIRLVDGKLEISGDSGTGEGNWNGTYTNIKPAIPTATSNSQVESAVPPPPAPAPAATNTPAPAEAAQNAPPASPPPVEPEKVYKIGDTGPGGGIVFYVERGTSGMEVSRLLGSHTWDEAVKIAKNYDGGGMNDWYLPTESELNLIYENLQKAKVMNLGTVIYWSSSPRPAGVAYYQRFSDGDQSYDNKVVSYSVRAVRVF